MGTDREDLPSGAGGSVRHSLGRELTGRLLHGVGITDTGFRGYEVGTGQVLGG